MLKCRFWQRRIFDIAIDEVTDATLGACIDGSRDFWRQARTWINAQQCASLSHAHNPSRWFAIWRHSVANFLYISKKCPRDRHEPIGRKVLANL